MRWSGPPTGHTKGLAGDSAPGQQTLTRAGDSAPVNRR
jgi:hypothetical protein